MFVLNIWGSSAQSSTPVPGPIREWPPPAEEADVPAKGATHRTSDHDGVWSYLKEIENYGAMSWWSSNTASTPPPAPSTTSANLAKDPKTVYYLGVIRTSIDRNERSQELVSDINLSMYNWLLERQYREPLLFSTKLIAERTPIGQRQRIPERGLAFYAYHTSYGFCVVLVTNADTDENDKKYYDLSAATILSKTADGFKSAFPANKIKTDPPSAFAWPKIKELRAEAEKVHLSGINATQRELDETKVILHKTIGEVLERGEKLESLVAKSDELGALSKGFYKQSKAQNSCCIVM